MSNIQEKILYIQSLHDTNIIFLLLLALTLIVVYILVAKRADRIFNETKNSKYAIIAIGFLAGAYFETLNTSYFLISILPVTRDLDPFIFGLFTFLENFVISVSIFIGSIYYSNFYKLFKFENKKTIYINLSLVLLAVSFVIISFYSISESHHFFALQKFITQNPFIETLDNIFYIFSAFFLINLKFSKKEKWLTPLSLTLIIISILQVYIGSSEFNVPDQFSKYLLMGKIILFGSIYLNLKEFNYVYEDYFLRQKIILYPASLLLFISFILPTILIYKYDILLPLGLRYVFSGIFILSGLFSLIIAKRMVKPITNLIKSLKLYDPSTKYELMPISNRDEIGILSEQFNENAELIWNYIEQINQKNIKKESLYEFIESVRASLNLEKIKNELTKKTGEILKADRVLFIEFDEEANRYLPVEHEYRSNELVKSMIGFIPEEQAPEIANRMKHQDEIFVEDFELVLQKPPYKGSLSEKLIKAFNVKSGFSIPLKYSGKHLGVLIIHYNQKKFFKKEDIDFARSLTTQITAAIYQARLYKNSKEIAKREALTRKVIETVRSSLDIEEIISITTKEIEKTFGTERVSIIKFNDPNDFANWTIKGEHRKEDHIKGIKSKEFNIDVAYFWGEKLFTTDKSYQVSDIKAFKIANDPEMTNIFKQAYENIGVKSIIMIPIKGNEKKWGGLFLSSYSENKIWDKNEIQALEAIAQQVFIGMNQAELYKKTQSLLTKEHIFSEVVAKIRSSLDIEEIEKTLLNESAKVIDADRIRINKYDAENDLLLESDRNCIYTKPGATDYHFTQEMINNNRSYIKKIKEFELISFKTIEEAFKKYDIKGTPEGKMLIDAHIQGALSVPVEYGGVLYGVYVFHFEKPNAFTDEDIEFVKLLGNQTAIAIHQANLYKETQEIAFKETILRELISEIKLSQDLKGVYSYIINKFCQIFNVDRVVFLETPTFKYGKPQIKYETIKDETLNKIGITPIPQRLITTFEKITDDLTPLVIEDTLESHKESDATKEFFNNFNIKSFIGIPLVRYNHETKILGVFLLCNKQKRKWSNKEIQLLLAIVESVVTVVWDISKITEIEKLRDTFISTLAHDLQVPLIAEHRALEFLKNRPENSKIGDFKELIDEIIINNQDTTKQLRKQLDIYHYELGKKVLKKNYCTLAEIINEILKDYNDLIKAKELKVKKEISANIPDVYVDKDEIKKAFTNLIENSIYYTQNGGLISVNIHLQESQVITCVNDNGPGLSDEIKEQIFKRYEMSKKIERKIGSGLGLYLTKLIVQAHKGEIFFVSGITKGSTFCVLLPIEKK